MKTEVKRPEAFVVVVAGVAAELRLRGIDSHHANVIPIGNQRIVLFIDQRWEDKEGGSDGGGVRGESQRRVILSKRT